MNPIDTHIQNLSLRQLGTRFLVGGFLVYGFGTLISFIGSPFECSAFASGGCLTKGIITIANAIAVGLVFIGVECLASLDEEIEVILARKHLMLVMIAGVITSFVPALIVRLVSVFISS